MTSIWSAAATRWNWRLSARVRLVSLLSLWGLIFAGFATGPLLPLLGIARMGASTAQLALNQDLARRAPIARRDRYDWGLLALAGSVAISAIVRASGIAPAPYMLLLVLVPYSGLQLRSYQRSMGAHAVIQRRLEPIPFPRAPQRRAA